MSLEQFKVTIFCDPPAFRDEEDDRTPAKGGPHEHKIRHEVADLLQEIALNVQSGMYEGQIKDSAGNTCCLFFFK